MMILRALVLVLFLASVARAQPSLVVLGAPLDNGLAGAADDLGLALGQSADPDPALYNVLLICAPQYPQVTPLSDVARRAVERFLAAGKTVYVEYTPLPGLMDDTPRTAVFERLCLPPDDPLASGLPAFSLFEEHSSRYLPLIAPGARVLVDYGRAAGTDRAVFGPAEDRFPALVSLPQGQGRLVVAATALSNWRRGRYRPTASWEALMRALLLSLLPPEQAQAARERFLDLQAWTEPREWAAPDQKVQLFVRPPEGADVRVTGSAGKTTLTSAAGLLTSAPMALLKGAYEWQVTATRGKSARTITVKISVSARADRYRQAVARNLRWFERAGMLIAPDGSAGVREGFTSSVAPEGKPAVASCPRVDCISESALLFSVYGRLCADETWLKRGRTMLQYTARAFQITSPNTWYFGHWQSRGEFRDDGSTLYVFNDDSGAGTLFSLLGYAETGDEAQLKAGLRGVEYFCHIASEKSGLFGYMPHRDYENSGHTGVPWPTLRAQQITDAAPHVMNLPLASLLVAYQLTGERRYLDVAERGCRTLMAVYPNWHLVTSRSCEHARMLLPLTLLQKVAPTAEHRRWLDTVADYLLSKQAPCGAIREWDGYNPQSNAAFGTAETSVFQQNGDPISDQLYDTGFALLHMTLAAQVAGDERLHQAALRLGDYLTRLQIREDSEYDGTWQRAFDFGRWEYFGSSADVGWGPYCTETGWMCAPLDLGLLLLDDPQALRLPDRPGRRADAAQAAKSEADAVEAALSAPPPAVGDAIVQPTRGPYAMLQWTAPTLQTFDYHVYRAPGTECPIDAPHRIGSATGGEFVDLQLQPETDYTYRVVAANGMGQEGAPGAPVRVKTGPPSKARGCAYTKSPAPYAGYPDVGDHASTDGLYAGPYADRKSYGYRLDEVGEKVAVTVTVDLGRAQRIARVTHHNCGAAGYRPDAMQVSVSTDGQVFAPVGTTATVLGSIMAVDFPEREARFVRFEFVKERRGAMDDWLFLDELEVF